MKYTIRKLVSLMVLMPLLIPYSLCMEHSPELIVNANDTGSVMTNQDRIVAAEEFKVLPLEIRRTILYLLILIELKAGRVATIPVILKDSGNTFITRSLDERSIYVCRAKTNQILRELEGYDIFCDYYSNRFFNEYQFFITKAGDVFLWDAKKNVVYAKNDVNRPSNNQHIWPGLVLYCRRALS